MNTGARGACVPASYPRPKMPPVAPPIVRRPGMGEKRRHGSPPGRPAAVAAPVSRGEGAARTAAAAASGSTAGAAAIDAQSGQSSGMPELSAPSRSPLLPRDVSRARRWPRSLLVAAAAGRMPPGVDTSDRPTAAFRAACRAAAAALASSSTSTSSPSSAEGGGGHPASVGAERVVPGQMCATRRLMRRVDSRARARMSWWRRCAPAASPSARRPLASPGSG